MPFFDNTGVDLEPRRGPFWATFATLRDQLERLIVVNLLWSLQLLPAIIALAFPELAGWLRLLLLVYTGVVIAPATALLYGLVRCAVAGEPLNQDAATDEWQRLAQPGVRTLGPLFATIGLLFWLATLVSSLGSMLIIIDVALRLAALLGLVLAQSWGPLLAEQPTLSARALLQQSALVAWRYPGPMLLLSAAALIALVIGAMSIGGLFLIVPVVVALLQTHMYRALRSCP